MSTDSGSADREVWQVMCGEVFDTAAGSSSSNIAATSAFHPSASWSGPTGGESWDAAASAASSARGWGHPRIETDDAMFEGSLTSMMRGIADEGMASLDKSCPWGTQLNTSKPDMGGPVTDSSGIQWNSLMGNIEQSSFGPFSSDSWSYFPNSGSTAESAQPKWDVPSSEKKTNDAVDSGTVESAPAFSKNDSFPKLSSSSGSELPEGHSRSSSVTVVASENSLSAMDASSSMSLGQPTSTAAQSVESSNSMIIEKLINSNEGWGKRPVRQDIPWVVDDGPESSVSDVTADASRLKAAPVGGPAEMPNSGLYWGNAPPRAAGVDFGDSDISVWNGPPDGGNSGLWGGLPKDSGWPGMTSLGLGDPAAVLSGPPPPLGSVPSLGLASHLLETSSCPGVPASFIDVMQRELTGTRDGLPPGSADAAWSQMLDTNRQGAAGDGTSGPVMGRDHMSPPSSLQKIDSWNDAAMRGQGLWNQPPPVMPAYQHQFPPSAGGVKKDDGMQFSQPQRGRMLRGQSTGEGGGFVFPDGGMPSGRASAFQPVFNSTVPPPAHRKQQSGGAGWPGSYSQPPAGGPQLSPVALQKMLELQAILQPLLNERSGIQQSKTLTALQRRQALDRLNPLIDTIKRQMDQLQGVPMAPMPGDAAPFGGDITSLLNRLRLDPETAAMMPGMQLPAAAAADIGSAMRAGPGNSPGSDAFAGSWMGMGAPQGQGGVPGWSEQMHAGVPRAMRGSAPAMQQFGNNGGGRSAVWSPQYSGGARMAMSEKVDAAGVKPNGSSFWLKISNIPPQLDGQVVQMLCTQYGQLTTFLYSKATSHAFACYTAADSIRRACTAFSSGAPGTVPLTTEPVTAETVTRLIESQQAAGWIQIPVIPNGSQMPLYCKP